MHDVAGLVFHVDHVLASRFVKIQVIIGKEVLLTRVGKQIEAPNGAFFR